MCLIQKIRKLVCWSEQPGPNVAWPIFGYIRNTANTFINNRYHNKTKNH